MKEDLKFRFVDSDIKPEEVEKLTIEEWRQLYNYKENRDKQIINASFSFSRTLIKVLIIFIVFLISMGILGYLIK